MSTELLVPLDGSILADTAVAHAAALGHKLRGSLHLVRVHVPAPALVAPPEAGLVMPPPLWDDELRSEQKAWLTTRARDVTATHALPVTSELREGGAVEQIVEVANTRHPRAIVCTTHGAGGWAPHWLGSVTDGIVRHATCPVFAMSEAASSRPTSVNKILVLLDGSHESSSILQHATWLARTTGASIELLRVVAPLWNDPSIPGFSPSREDPLGVDAFAEVAKRSLDLMASELRRDGFSVRSIVQVHQHPARAILDYVAESDPDVIAMATHGRGLSRFFLGSVADKVLRASGRPTLLFHPPRAVVEESSAHASSAERELRAARAMASTAA